MKSTMPIKKKRSEKEFMEIQLEFLLILESATAKIAATETGNDRTFRDQLERIQQSFTSRWREYDKKYRPGVLTIENKCEPSQAI